jgi:hypothetical protein
MKKNTKIIVWSIVGLAVATVSFFGIRSLVKKSKLTRTATDTPPPPSDGKKEVVNNTLGGKAIINRSPDDQLLQDIKDQKLNNKF